MSLDDGNGHSLEDCGTCKICREFIDEQRERELLKGEEEPEEESESTT